MMTESPSYTRERLVWLQLLDDRGEEVTYRRGDLVVEGLRVVFTGASSTQSPLGDQAQLQNRQLDCLIDPDSLVSESGERIEPKRGDRIERASGEIRKVFSPNNSKGTWRWSDAKQTWRRVFTEES